MTMDRKPSQRAKTSAGNKMTTPEERAKELVKAEADNPLGWWYLSYADAEGFRGGVIIEEHGFASAAMLSRILGYSPGGEVLGLPIPAEHLPAESYRNRLLTLADLGEFWGMSKLSDLEK
jgi:hypothetical protein